MEQCAATLECLWNALNKYVEAMEQVVLVFF